LAGFQVTLIGRFWVTAEECTHPQCENRLAQRSQDGGTASISDLPVPSHFRN